MQSALPRTNSFAYAILLFIIALAIPFLSFAQHSPAPPDEKAVRKRVDALLKQMTLEEKIGQLSQLFDFPESKAMIGGGGQVRNWFRALRHRSDRN